MSSITSECMFLLNELLSALVRVPSEEYSDDGQTDYEEEDAAGSALSDYEMSYLTGELTEEEETADTAETVRLRPTRRQESR